MLCCSVFLLNITNLQPSAVIHTVGPHSVTFSTCGVQLKDCCIPLLLDTGAKVSLLNMATYKKFFSDVELQPSPLKLCGYGQASIAVTGVVKLPVQYGQKQLPEFPFYITQHGANILGLDLFLSLDFSMHDNSGATILQVDSPWQTQFPALFGGLGCLSVFSHKPLLNPNVPPVIQPLRRVPLAMRDKVTTELQGMLAADLIEPIDASPWVSNLVIVQKRSGGMRLCIDLRGPNKAVVPDKYPLLTIEELTTLFYGSSVFTKLDLKQGYMQIPLHEDSRNLTAFVTHMGLFRFKRIPFGLSSAPSCFQKIMATVLAGLPGTAVYLDDIVVHGKDVATHDECLRRVFTALSRHNLTLNTEKCVFSAPAIDFVGLRVSSSGIAPLQSNVEAILNLQVPTSAGQLASFLSMTAYYLRFLPQYSEITSPLRQLLKHNTPWTWTADCEQAAPISSAPSEHFDSGTGSSTSVQHESQI